MRMGVAETSGRGENEYSIATCFNSLISIVRRKAATEVAS